MVEQGFQNVTDLAFDGAGNLVVSGGNLPGAGGHSPRSEQTAPRSTSPRTRVASVDNRQQSHPVRTDRWLSPDRQASTGSPRTVEQCMTVKGGNAASTTAPLSNALTAATGTGAHRIRETFYGGDGITTGTAGQIYADARPFIGLTLDTIVQLSPGGRATVLWRS